VVRRRCRAEERDAVPFRGLRVPGQPQLSAMQGGSAAWRVPDRRRDWGEFGESRALPPFPSEAAIGEMRLFAGRSHPEATTGIEPV
jgi:hypothetical protein